jgi:FkbM family methyltransferase
MVSMATNQDENPNHAATDRQRLALLSKLGVRLRHFFDIGASNGVWSTQVSADFPEATFDLFEPLVDHVPAYREKLEPRLAGHPGFRLHKLALGAECKKSSFYLYSTPVSSTGLRLQYVPQDAKCLEVDVLTIDYVVQEFRLPVPQLIKVDTQGCELNILKGARRTLPQVEVLLLECWLTRGYGKTTPLLDEVAEWLRGFNFYLWDLGNGWRDPSGSLVAQDCLFLNARSKASQLRGELPSEASAAQAQERLAGNILLRGLRRFIPRRSSGHGKTDRAHKAH